jgi:UDP-N-acetyl-D-mannosaminuronic acid dehydrogenase
VKGQIFTTTATTAEMVKLMENTYRDVNIAIANEFSRLADRFGIDVWEAIQLANKHPRVKILNPGPGVGGHCISVDPWFLVEAAPDITSLVRTARQVNDSQPHFVIELVKRALKGSLAGKKAAVLGLSFKPDVDDLRESPAVEVAQLLGKEGMLVSAFEPFKPDAKFEGFETLPSLDRAIAKAEIILVLVGHTQFKNLDPRVIKKNTNANIILDCANSLDPKTWQSAGFQVIRLGVNN